MYTHRKVKAPKDYRKPKKHVLHAHPPPNTAMKLKDRIQDPREYLFELNRESKKNVKSYMGRVYSNRMDKTATVLVPRKRYNKLLQKPMREYKKFKAHDPYNECRIGDLVEIHFDRKRSKTKSFLVTKIIVPSRTGYEPLWPLERQPPSLNPEKALAPQVYLPQDIYRDDVSGLYAPHISDFVMAQTGRGPALVRPVEVGDTVYHPMDTRNPPLPDETNLHRQSMI